MQPEGAELVRQSMLKAQNDLLLARRAADGEPPLLDGCVYHCQQAAEKALNGFLASHDRPLLRTHSLPELVVTCMEIDNAFDTLRDAAITLNPYAVQFQYPGEQIAPPPEVAQEAIQRAQQVMDFVVAHLPEDVGFLER